METHLLLRGEGSGRLRDRLPAFKRRSDAIAYGSSYQKAAALVDLAEDGIGLPEEILDDEASFAEAAKLYFFFIRFDIIWSLNYFALLLLNFLEKPLWCSQNLAISCEDRDYYFLGELPYLSGAGSLIYEGVTLVILMAHMFFPISYEGFNLYWKSHLNKLKILFLLILVVDVLIYVLYLSPVAFYSLPFRIAPYVRVVFFILNIRDLRETLVVLAGMVVTYVNVLLLGLLFLLFSSWLAYVIFEDTEQGTTLFNSFSATTYHMFILFTTSNNPDVWIPAYKASRCFKGELVKQVVAKDRLRTGILKKAFDLIDSNKSNYLNKEQCISLFKELGSYRSLPNISEEDYGSIFDELDDSHDFRINFEEFTDICNAIALKFQKEDSLPWLMKYSFYRATFSEKLKTFVRDPKFEYVVIFVLMLNLVAVVIETTLDIQDSSGQNFWQQLEFVFGWLYFLEMVLKVYSYGFENYWKDGQNRFDFIITVVIVVVETTTFVSPKGLSFLSNGEWIRYLLIVLYSVCYACIAHWGCRSLGDCGMVTLFNLLVMGNWQAWMQSYKELTSAWSYIYFVSFYLVTILLLLNLVVAFVLEAFFAEMEIEDAEKCSDKDDEGEGKESRRRSAGTKTRSQRVEMLLHHMLSSELDQQHAQCADA
ncbi:Two pore calcium channel protein 1 [Heracleum sosnowskyi]|uniref:Two pore calcium channel protein 1 n=1 Tax=Heracleum sosnowskyi TaxID=360622 RepID=A0AAD8J201_9APIA|nr:Two pore calcium channel protein 1 [Heracleum sosnowskyi]